MKRLSYLAVLILLSSCVTNKKYIYLQKDDVDKKNLPKDSVVRTYDLHINEYKIQPLDIVSIHIVSLTDEEYDFFQKLNPLSLGPQQMALNPLTGFLVDINGEIEYPVIGKVHIGGLTVFQARDFIKSKVAPYLKDPVVNVRMLNFRFTVLGEVTAEQVVVSGNTRLTFMEAISLAGGLKEFANRKDVKVVRQKGDQSEVFYVNLLDEKFIGSPYYYVQQNDVIIVPSLRQRPFRNYLQQNIGLVFTTLNSFLLIYILINNASKQNTP